MTDREILDKIYAAAQKQMVYTTEALLLKHVRAFVELLPKAKLTRIEAGSERGNSDVIICYRGRFIAVELKDNIGKPTKQQLIYIKEIRESGGIAGICRNLLDVYNLLLQTYL